MEPRLRPRAYRNQDRSRPKARAGAKSGSTVARVLSRGRRRIAAATGLVLIALLTSCSASPAVPEPTPTGLPEGVTVALLQLRSDVAARQAEVEVRNDSDQPIKVGGVAVSDPRFAEDATRVIEKTSTISPGGTVNIRIQLPELTCGVTDAASTVALRFLEGDAEVVRTAPLPDRLEFLPPLYERECRAQALADVATVTIDSFEPSPAGVPADLALRIEPTGAGGATISAIQTTNLLAFTTATGGSFPIDLALAPGETTPTTVNLPLVPLRCDPHAVQEDKRGTVFNVEVVLDGEPGLVQVAATEEMRGRILTWVANWCGFGEG